MKKAPDPVDRLVGQNIRIFRKAKGLSQTALGHALDVTFQQIQKYENGINRVGSGRLAKIAKVLGVPVARFFHNRSTDIEGDGEGDAVTDLLASPYALRMLKALGKISNNKVRLSLVSLTESVAERRQ
jgi:transcriptional regulator with XRE-family HTH domain